MSDCHHYILHVSIVSRAHFDECMNGAANQTRCAFLLSPPLYFVDEHSAGFDPFEGTVIVSVAMTRNYACLLRPGHVPLHG